jgi:hypothetical protein
MSSAAQGHIDAVIFDLRRAVNVYLATNNGERANAIRELIGKLDFEKSKTKEWEASSDEFSNRTA